MSHTLKLVFLFLLLKKILTNSIVINETEGFHGNDNPPTRVSSDGGESDPPQTPPSLKTRDGGSPTRVSGIQPTTDPSLTRNVRRRVFTATTTLPLAFRVTEGNPTHHRPLPRLKREWEVFWTNTNPLTCVLSDGGDFDPPQIPPSLEMRDGGFSWQHQPILFVGGDLRAR